MKWPTLRHTRAMRVARAQRVRHLTRSEWHRWFAWYPITVRVDGEYWIWLEFIER